MKAALSSHVLQLAGICFVLCLWEVSAHLTGLGPLVFPTVEDVVPTLGRLVVDGEVVDPWLGTLGRAIGGFAIGFVFALLYAVLCFNSARFEQYAQGILTVLLFTPTLIVIFLGLLMIGITNKGVIIVVAIATVGEVGVYLRGSLQSLSRPLLQMAGSYHASFALRVREIYLPYLIPGMLAASRVGFTLAWKITLLAEVFGFPGGIGYRIQRSFSVFRMQELLSWLIVFAISLLLVEQLLRLFERRIGRAHRLTSV